jgi:hypothetical protein
MFRKAFWARVSRTLLLETDPVFLRGARAPSPQNQPALLLPGSLATWLQSTGSSCLQEPGLGWLNSAYQRHCTVEKDLCDRFLGTAVAWFKVMSSTCSDLLEATVSRLSDKCAVACSPRPPRPPAFAQLAASLPPGDGGGQAGP